MPIADRILDLAVASGRGARHLAALVVPVECPGCGLLDVRCCPACAGLLAGPPRRREQGAPRLDRLNGIPPLPVWSPAEYSGPVRGIVVAWKDRGRADLDPLVGGALRATGAALAGQVGERVLVVPAPSSRAATRSRGRHVVAGLAAAFADGLSSAGAVSEVGLVLAQRRPGEQVGRGVRGRGARLGAVRLRRGVVVAGLDCLLVDDVLTTGATLVACMDALVAGGARVIGAVVLAATPAPGARDSARGSNTRIDGVSPVVWAG